MDLNECLNISTQYGEGKGDWIWGEGKDTKVMNIK